MDKSSATQVTDIVDTYRRRAELVSACYCQQATTLVSDSDSDSRLTDLGEGPSTENSVDTQRTGHANDLSISPERNTSRLCLCENRCAGFRDRRHWHP
jgi:hypothetical protein